MKRFKELKLKDAELPMGVVLKKPTNADRIRSMSDEELAEIIACPKGLFDRMECFEYSRHCEDCVLEWLQQPAEEG